MKKRFLYRLNNVIITLIFCIAIFTPFFVGIIEKDKDVSEIEKRELSKYPEVPQNVDAIQQFPELFDTYYSDHFGLREWFTKYYKLAKYNIGDSPSKDVTMGKNGWIFLGSIKNGYINYSDPIGDVRNVNLYSQEELKETVNQLRGLKSWLSERGIAYVFVIAPNKHTIYFEQLPNYITKVNEKSATDQLVEYLRKHTNITVVDLREQLIREKEKHQIYEKTDTHWNQYGANVAQYEIMKVIYNIFPTKISPELLSKSMFKSYVISDTVRDLEKLSGIKITQSSIKSSPIWGNSCIPKKHIYDEKGRPIYTMICEEQKLNAVIFGDSFFWALLPYFSRKFRRSTYIFEKLNLPSLEKYIELKKPDIIIEELVERKLPYFPNIIDEFTIALTKERFKDSDKLIFSNDWIKLNYAQHLNLVDNKNDAIQLISTGNDPIIDFEPLPFKTNSEYILHINMVSSITSTLQLFFSDINNSGYPFFEDNSVIKQISQGENDIYILLDYQNISKYLRLDPISEIGEITIKTLEIKEVGLE